jgi:S1-C subfamily serine protease
MRIISILFRLLIVFFTILYGLAYAEENMDRSSMFENDGKSVVQFNIAIKLDSSKIKCVDLFRKLESELKTPILDHYYGALLGSAFIISKDGYLISNHHVSKYLTKKEAGERLRYKLISDMTNKLTPGVLTENEIRRIFEVLNSYTADSSSFKQIVTTWDEKKYEVRVIKENQQDDLSLMKVIGEDKFMPLPLNAVDAVKTGQEVHAMGFPGTLENLFTETKVTFTSGVISAIRDDKWGIQHTASVNFGNSGGPLLDSHHKVVGVNVGMVTNANGLFFSVPAVKLVQWLKESGYEKIME